MAYIKLKKAGSAFDIISAEDVIHVKLVSGNIEVAYSNATKATIFGFTPAQADVQLIIDAIAKVGGTESPAELVTLSSEAVEVTGSTLS